MNILNVHDARGVILSTIPEKDDCCQSSSLTPVVVEQVNFFNWLAKKSVANPNSSLSFCHNPLLHVIDQIS